MKTNLEAVKAEESTLPLVEGGGGTGHRATPPGGGASCPVVNKHPDLWEPEQAHVWVRRDCDSTRSALLLSFAHPSFVCGDSAETLKLTFAEKLFFPNI